MSGELKALNNLHRWLFERTIKRSDDLRAGAAMSALALLNEYMAERESECSHCAAGDAYHWLGHPTAVKP